MNLKIFTGSNVMYGLVGIIMGRPFLQNNLARREAMLVHPRFQVALLLLLLSGGNDGGFVAAGQQGVAVGGGAVTFPAEGTAAALAD